MIRDSEFDKPSERKEEVKNARLGAESTSANTVEYYVVIDKALRFQLHKKQISTNPFSDKIRDSDSSGESSIAEEW